MICYVDDFARLLRANEYVKADFLKNNQINREIQSICLVIISQTACICSLNNSSHEGKTSYLSANDFQLF